jgi:hypothetical protein
MSGPTIPELAAVVDQQKIIDRATVNAWHDQRVVEGLRATGRHN